MAGAVVAFRRDLDIREIGSLMKGTHNLRPHRAALEAAALRLARELEWQVKDDSFISRQELSYDSEDELLQYADRLSDFLILDLVDHFRSYDRRYMPGY